MEWEHTHMGSSGVSDDSLCLSRGSALQEKHSSRHLPAHTCSQGVISKVLGKDKGTSAFFLLSWSRTGTLFTFLIHVALFAVSN